MSGLPTRRAWIEVDLDALVRNARRLAARISPARLLPMVTADGCGLGAIEIARALESLEPYAFGVATPEEGVALRRAGVTTRVIVFSPCAETEAGTILDAGLEPAVLSLGSLERWAATGRESAIHLEVDTGIGRAGLPAEETAAWAPRLARTLEAGRLRLASTYSHFHSADRDSGETDRQLERFLEAVALLRAHGIDPGARHMANTPASLRDRRYHLDLVRAGLYLYGGGTSADAGTEAVEPVAHVRARALEVRELPAGATVSYGATHVTERSGRFATLGIGYADGLPSGVANQRVAAVDGQRVWVRGTVCMDVTVVDVTEVEGIEAGSVFTLLGSSDGETISLADVAGAAGVIEYEVLTGLGRRLPRVYTGRSVEEKRLAHVE